MYRLKSWSRNGGDTDTWTMWFLPSFLVLIILHFMSSKQCEVENFLYTPYFDSIRT